MPSQDDAIKFYRGFLKLVPDLAARPQKGVMVVLTQVFEATFNVSPTREHMLAALAGHKKNDQKRKWDLKQQFIILQFLQRPNASNGEVFRVVAEKFGQRTRETVLRSCKEMANLIRGTSSQEQLDAYIGDVQKQLTDKSKDVNVLA